MKLCERAAIAALIVFPCMTHANETESDASRSAVPDLFDQRGVLTPAGGTVLEPSFAYAHTSSTVVAVEGLTIIPALVVGLINVTQSQRDLETLALTLRHGFSNRFEAGLRLPYLNEEESIRERKIFDSSPVDIISDSSGHGMGDAELQLAYQFTPVSGAEPVYVGNLRVKSTTGTSPYQVKRRTLQDDKGNDIGVILDEQPTGTGFWSVQPGVSAMIPSDPAILYGALSYQFNLADKKAKEFGGRIDPGDALNLNLGLGFSVNEKTSFSLGYDHTVVFKTQLENNADKLSATFDLVHVGSLLFGISQGISDKRLSFSLAVGVTPDAPDVQMTFKMPFAL